MWNARKITQWPLASSDTAKVRQLFLDFTFNIKSHYSFLHAKQVDTNTVSYYACFLQYPKLRKIEVDFIKELGKE